ncbi:LuxR C-terminal-related transcriptional regulator [Paenibacillus sp. FSL W8-0426]|uniref:LuxR C-terminal-related transcriptional regulator n=1 Tax=Paenibacillus sp. FSL W8-0426 TaxID=2921714 RepID=UPI0030DAA2FF
MRANPDIMKYKLEVPEPRKHWINRKLIQPPSAGDLPQGITLITAPAGSGKTTAMTQIAHSGNHQIAWYALDEHDNDLRRFWRYLVHMLHPYLTAGASDRLLSLLAEYADRSLKPFLDQYLNDVYDIQPSICVVLDDYHVIWNEEIHETLNYWLHHLPANIHVLIGSRSEPPLKGWQTWNVKGKLRKVNALQLAFTAEQAQEMCKTILGGELPKEWVNVLIKRTEGWAAGLQLALISLQQRPSGEWADWVRHLDMDQYIEQYLLEEIWNGLDEQVQRFLLETSALARFNAMLCEEVTGLAECGEKLEFLQSNGLFLIPLEGGYFRYHHLVGHFYETRLRERSPERWLELKRNTSKAYARMGWHEEAVEFAFAGKAYDAASAILEEHLHGFVQRGEFSLLHDWLARFPAKFPVSDRIRLVRVFVSSVLGKHEDARTMMETMENELFGTPLQPEQLELLSGLFFVKGNAAFHSGQFQEWFRFAESFQLRLPQDPVFFDFNYNFNQPLVRYTTFGLGGVLTETTAELGQRITTILEQNGWEESLMCQYVMQSLVEGYYEWNDLDRCRTLLDRITAKGRYLKVPGLFVPVRLMMARLSVASGDRAGARVIVEQTLQRMDRVSDMPWHRSLITFLAEMDLAEGAVDQAEMRFKEIHLSPDHRVHLGSIQETLVLARLLLAQGRADEGQRLLMQLSLLAEESGMANVAVSSSVLQAWGDLVQGKRKQAAERISTALQRVMPFRYTRTFVDEGGWMQRLLEEMMVHSAFDNQPALKSYAAELLSVLKAEGNGEAAEAQLDIDGYELTAKEIEMVKLLHLGCMNREIADQMGLSPGTVKVYLNRIYNKLGVRTRTQAVLVTTPVPLAYPPYPG